MRGRRVGDELASMLIKRDAIATDIRPWNGHSAIMSPLTCDVGTYSIVGPSDDVTRGDSLEPEFGLSIEYGESEVPGTLLPSPGLTLPSRLSAMDDFGHREQRSSLEAEDNLSIGPKRVSSSPNKSRRGERYSEREDSLFGPPAHKKLCVYNEPDSMQNKVGAFMTDIRPLSVQSEPVMSPLTFDVRTHPIAAPTEEITRRDSSKSFGTRNACPPQDQTTQSATTKTLYVAYDVLDPVEIRALEIMHHQGFLRVVLDGIQGVTIGPGRCQSPFPAILVTHGVDKSGGITTCYRSCSYLTAVALGALVVDARWLIDSQHAGFLLDCEKYKIRSDLESHSSLTAAPLTLFHKLDGITLGLLKDLDSSPPAKSKERSVSQVNSQLRLETRRITSQEIESLVNIIGGRIITDELTYSDILLVDDWMTFNQITKALQRILAFSNVNRWSIRKCQIAELSDFVEKNLAGHCRGGIHATIPIIRSKWLEDSICLKSLLCLDSYCLGILCP
ncbi:hypothetical protein ACHAW5_004451 [Stephanodiscus triporus]|uniref:BRCT domain-containing protein n=1 Tax=Stephanodiscus triporus TaxID=2934178 RepID=A0ABD3QJM2_9STRA